MSIPRANYDPRRVCLISVPDILGPKKREIGVYTAGALFTLGWWCFLDACLLSSRAQPPADAPFDTVPVHVGFPDWLAPIFSTLGMMVVNLIDKQRLLGDGEGGAFSSSSYDSAAWKARLFLFLGFALMAGGLAGSITILLLKYVIPGFSETWQFVKWWGMANVLQSALTMLSAIILWMAQSGESDYEYNLTL